MSELLYIHCPKTAGTSLRRTLGSDGGFGDYSARTFAEHDAVRTVSFSHATPTGLLSFGRVSQHDLDRWHIFATIRNPWARLVSGYCNGLQSPRSVIREWFSSRWSSFEGFVEWVLTADVPAPDRGGMKKGQWVHPQVCWFHIGERYIVDTLLRVENLTDEWSVFAAKMGLPGSIGSHGASTHEPYRTYYSQSLQVRVGKHYAADAELGHYSF